MKKLLTLSLLAIAATSIDASQVHKKSGAYMAFKGTYVANKDPDLAQPDAYQFNGEDMMMPGLALGYKFNAPIRLEVDLKYRSKSREESGATIDTSHPRGSINAYYDIYTKTIFTPYLTLGVSLGKISADMSLTPSSTPANLYIGYRSFDVGAGARVKLAQNVDLDLCYKYGWSSVIRSKVPLGYDSAIGEKFNQHQSTIGLIYNF